MNRIQLVTIALATVLLLSCSPKVDNGGYVNDGDIKEQITIGKTTKDEVISKLGSPSSQSSFGDESWYYVTDRKEGYAFLKPHVVQQNVVRISFDSAGVVSDIKDFNEKDAKQFAIVKRSTPTEGHTLGFFEQVLGNIGRFNSPSSNDSIAPGRKPGS